MGLKATTEEGVRRRGERQGGGRREGETGRKGEEVRERREEMGLQGVGGEGVTGREEGRS